MSTREQLTQRLIECVNEMDILTRRLTECQRRGPTLLSRLLTGDYEPEQEDVETVRNDAKT